MAFGDDLRMFAEKVERRSKEVFLTTVGMTHESVTEGSAVTGAPGQPVDTGNLKASWIEEYPEEWVGEVYTGVEYARPIEDGQGPHGPLMLRSDVGGFHSVKLTRANWDRIVEHATREVQGV